MSLHRSAAHKSSLRTTARRFNGNSTPSSDSPQSPADTLNQVVFNSGGTDGRSRVRLTNNRSLPSPLDQIDPRRWKHFPRFSTTSDFATFPFSDIDVSEEEAHLSADEHSIIGIKSGLHEHSSQEPTLVVSTPETRIRSAAAGIRRAVSDSSDKIRRMTLKLRRAPSTLLNRSSRVFGSQSPVAIRSGYKGLQFSNSRNSREQETMNPPQPSEGQLQQLENLRTKFFRTIARPNSDELSVASCTVAPVHTPSRIQPTTEATCEGQLMIDQETEKTSPPSLCQESPTQNDSTSPLTRVEGMSDSQRNSLMDRLASYPQESLAWLAKDSLLNHSPVSLTDQNNTVFHELSGQCQQDRRKVYSVASGVTDRPLLRTKMSLPEMGTHIVSDKPKCLRLTSGDLKIRGHGTRELGVYLGTGQTERDIDDSSAAKHSMEIGVLYKNKTNSSYRTKLDEGTPTKARPSLRRTVSRIFGGGTSGTNNENQKS